MSRILILDKKGELGESINVGKYDMVRELDFLNTMQSIVIKRGKKMKGEIIVTKINSSDHTFIEGRYFVNDDKKFDFEEVEVKFTLKHSNQEKTKTWSQKEKIEKLKSFFEKKGRLPEKDEHFDNCPVGAFYINVTKWKGVCDEVRDAEKGFIEKVNYADENDESEQTDEDESSTHHAKRTTKQLSDIDDIGDIDALMAKYDKEDEEAETQQHKSSSNVNEIDDVDFDNLL